MRAFFTDPSTDLEAVSASIRARKSAQPLHFFDKPCSSFRFANRCVPQLLSVDWSSFGGSLVSQREPPPTAGTCAQSPHTRHDVHKSHTQDHRHSPTAKIEHCLVWQPPSSITERPAKLVWWCQQAKISVGRGLLLEFFIHTHTRDLF